MSRLLRLSLAALLAAVLLPAVAAAHLGGEPFVLVPLDHVTPGKSFPVIGADLGPNSVVSLKLVRSDRAVPLGRVTAQRNGHFTTERFLPASVPEGYAQLVASGSTGSSASAWILVGERKESAAPGSASGRILTVAAVTVGAALLALAVVVRIALRHRRGSTPLL